MKQSKFKDKYFNSREEFQEFLKNNAYMVIRFKDKKQSLLEMTIDREGEIIDVPEDVERWIGRFVDISLPIEKNGTVFVTYEKGEEFIDLKLKITEVTILKK